MRILQIINALTLGGAQFVMLDLALHARNDGCEVEVACFRDGPIGSMLRQEGFKVHILGETFLDLPAAIKLAGVLARFKPDVVHSHLFRATLWARICCRFSRKTKLITSIHGCETASFHHLERLMNRLSDGLVFPSRFLRDWYISRIRSRKGDECSVIYPGVHIAEPDDRQQTGDTVRIGTLSRLHPVKGIDRLIEACSLLKNRKIKFELSIGGDGRHRTELERLAKEFAIENSCRFCGEISDRQSFLDTLDIFVAPSRQEAFGIHVCEAMERSLAIIGADIGGIPELIENNQTGLLFNPEHKGDLADKLETLACNPDLRRTLGQNARSRVENTFNRKTAVSRHLELFERLSAKKRHVHFAISSVELGGGERLALGTIKWLITRGWQVSATCAGNPLATAIAETGATVHTADMRCGGLFYALKLLAALCILRPDVISSHLNRASLAAGLLGKLCRIPSVSHVHGLNQKSYYQFSDHLIAVSHAVKRHLASQNADLANIHVITNQIDKPALTPRAHAGNPLRLAITAKLHKNKGHLWALEAIEKNLDRLGKLRIDILGDGPEKAALEKFCKESRLRNCVFFHGFVNDPELFYGSIDIALLPSLGEGIPLSLLETMRWGIPCVATDIGGIPEIVENNANGMLIKIGDKEGLVNAICQICANYEKFSISAVEHFKRINNYSQMIDEFENLLLQATRPK